MMTSITLVVGRREGGGCISVLTSPPYQSRVTPEIPPRVRFGLYSPPMGVERGNILTPLVPMDVVVVKNADETLHRKQR